MPAAEKQAAARGRSAARASSRRCRRALAREIALLEVKGKIESQAQQEMTDAQRQYYLRQQLKAIQEELGEGEADEIKVLREKVDGGEPARTRRSRRPTASWTGWRA